MTQTLYSLRTDPSGYRITKFVDGEVESSYLTSTDACECPAGHRHTCRHRQMLPQMLAHGIADTHWFMDWDRSGSIVDFNGASKRLYDQLAATATGEISPTLAVGDALLVAQAKDTKAEVKHIPDEAIEIIHPQPRVKIRTGLPPTSWRRL